MGLSRRTASRTTSNLRTGYWAKSLPLLVALISASTFLVSCATPDVLGDKEEYARQSGKGGVIGIHQGLESIDDPLVTKLRTALLQDEFLQQPGYPACASGSGGRSARGVRPSPRPERGCDYRGNCRNIGSAP